MTIIEDKHIEDKDVNFKVEPMEIEPDNPTSALSSLLLKMLAVVIVAWLLTFTIQQIRINQITGSLEVTQQELHQIQNILNPDQQALNAKLQDFEAMERAYKDICAQLENPPEECSIFTK